VAAGIRAALLADPALRICVVGPAADVAALLGDEYDDNHGDDGDAVGGPDLSSSGRSWSPRGRLSVLDADAHIGMADPPVRALRARQNASVRIAVHAVATGQADGMVSVGPTGATVAAAITELGLWSGVRRPPLAVVIPSDHPVVLLDVGAHPDPTVADLLGHARLGVAYAVRALGIPAPRVGLLSIGIEPGKGDALRRRADREFRLAGEGALRETLPAAGTGRSADEPEPLRYVGLVEGDAVPLGGPADVVVTDGFTGNVVLKALEGMTEALGRKPGHDRRAAVLLGVRGTVVVGHGAADAAEVTDCLQVAAEVVRRRSPVEPMGSAEVG
jgi:glycerol-3-phosphate acyltransferase PlsX